MVDRNVWGKAGREAGGQEDVTVFQAKYAPAIVDRSGSNFKDRGSRGWGRGE